MTSSRIKTPAIAALLALFAFLGLGSWALASPVGASPDDDFHLASIWCSLGEREGICESGASSGERKVQERLVASSACYAYDNEQSAACDLSDEAYVSTSRGNFDGTYPPLFYGTMGLFASTDVAASTVVMRLFNALILVGGLTALFLMLRKGERGSLVWGIAVSIVPLGMFIIPSVNPSSWAVTSAATLWVALLGYFTAERRSLAFGFGTIALLSAVMGSGARGDSATYVALTAVIVGVLSFRMTKTWFLKAILPVAIGIMAVFFFLTSAQTSSSVVQGTESPDLSPDSVVLSLLTNIPKLPSLWVGNLGTWGLGWLDTSMPPAVWVTMIGLYGAIVFWGIRRLFLKKSIALGISLASLVAIPMYVVVRDQIVIGSYIQPRYVLPLMVLTAGLALYGLKQDSLGLSRTQGALVFLGIAAANSLALYTNMRRYITGFDYSGFSLDSNAEWWWSIPLTPMTVWFVGSGSLALLLFGLFLVFFGKPPSRAEAEVDSGYVEA